MRDATLCLLLKGDSILLAMKKRGFGVGKWNGVGGKVSPQDKSISEATIRETKEEIGVSVKDLKKVAVLRFRFPHKEEWDQDVHVFLTNKWTGQPKETEEMCPRWFKTNEIPYKEMWADDRVWLPHVLAGQKLEADFVFREGEIIDKHHLDFVKEI